MIGAIAGDIAGSVYEFDNVVDDQFPLFRNDCFFTDDTVLTCCVARFAMFGGDLVDMFHQAVDDYPHLSWGMRFRDWATSGARHPYHSHGNGSAMRVSAVGFAYDSMDEVMAMAEETASVTHNDPEGVRGAQATAVSILLAREGNSKPEIQEYIECEFGYSLGTPLDEVRESYCFDESCQGTVPYAIRAFLESEDHEDALRKAIWLGGDSDTIACIAGGIAEAFYGEVSPSIREIVFEKLDGPLADVVREFEQRVQRSGKE